MPQYVGQVFIDVKFDTAKIGGDLSKSLGTAASEGAQGLNKSLGTKLSQFGTDATRVGRQVSFGISAPLLGIGVAAVKGFAGFESSMTKIQALVGASASQVKDWTGQVRGIGIEFGIGAQAAGDALYYITSSGITAGAAIDVLRVASKASAVGLGSMTDISDLLTSALNAYGPSGLTATKAIDQLLVAVKDGKNEPKELASSMGTVFPIASKLGVSFDQLAGSFAAMSLNGTSADEAATQLRGILNGLLDPTQEARRGFAAVGLSVEGLQQSLKEQGLLPTLQQMQSSFGGNSEAMAKAFGNVRALTGVFTLLGSNTAGVEKIMNDTKQATGELDKAFDIVKETTEFKLNKAMASLHDSLLDVGQSAAPVAIQLAGAAGFMAKGFAALGPQVGGVVTVIGALGVAAGPLIYSFGSLASLAGGAAKALPGLASVLDHTKNSMGFLNDDLRQGNAAQNLLARSSSKVADSVGGMKGALAAGGVAVAGITAAFAIWNSKMQESDEAIGVIQHQIGAQVDQRGLDSVGSQITKNQKAAEGIIDELEKMKGAGGLFNPLDADYIESQTKLAVALHSSNDELKRQAALAYQLQGATGADANQLFTWIRAQEAAGVKFPSLNAALAEWNKQQLKGGAATQVATTAIGQQLTGVKGLSDAYFGVRDANTALADAQLKVLDAARGVDDANRGVTDALRDQSDAVADAAKARRSQALAVQAVADAKRNVVDAQTALTDAEKGTDDAIALDEAKLGLKEAKAALAKGKFATPIDRERAQLDVRRAQQTLDKAEGANAKNVTKAKLDLRNAQDAVVAANQSAIDAHTAVRDADLKVEDSGRKVEAAHRGVEAAQRAVTKANDDSLDAAGKAAAATDGLSGALQSAGGNALGLVSYLEALKALYPEVAAQVQPTIDNLARLVSPGYKTPDGRGIDPRNGQPIGPPGPTYGHGLIGPPLPGRASGGAVDFGSTYQVDEKLPELFSAGGKQYLIPMGSGGEVVPLKAMANVAVKGGDGGVNVGDIIVQQISRTDEQTAWNVRNSLRKATFLNAAGAKS